MNISILGSGTSQGIPVIGCECKTCTSTDPRDRRFRTSCLIEINNKRIVIDIGPDFRQQMLDYGGKEIHAIIITHEHNDHVAGLDDVRPFNFKYFKDIPVYGLPRINKYLRNRFDYIFKEQQYPGAPMISLHDIEKHPFTIENIKITPIQIMHGPLPILGYRINDFAYLTDVKTIPIEEFKKLEQLEVLVLSALRYKEHHSHLTLLEAIDLAKKINAKKTYFTHFSHLLGPHEKIEQQLDHNIFAAYDGMSISL